MSTSRKPLEKRLAERIARKKVTIFLRRDFEDLGGYDQVGRGLRNLTVAGQLVRIGYGVYARAVMSPVSGKMRIPLMWNAESGDLERGFRRSGTLVGAQRRLVSQ